MFSLCLSLSVSNNARSQPDLGGGGKEIWVFKIPRFFFKLVHTFQDVVDSDSINHDYSYDIKDHCEIIFVSKKLIYTHQAHKVYKKVTFLGEKFPYPPYDIQDQKFFNDFSSSNLYFR